VDTNIMNLKIFLAAFTMCGVLSAAPQKKPDFGPQPSVATQSELLKIREAAWRAWFSNDVQGFNRVVPDELIAIGWSGGEFSDRNATLQQMTEFAKSGQKISELQFPENVFQQYGDVVVLYTRFRITLLSPDQQLQTVVGRGTEIFVKRKGRWIHTGWHLDAVANKP
jgi:hypothetical protein